MSTIYLHIGTPKTGTKALQSFLKNNNEILQKQEYCYPTLSLNIESRYNSRNGQFLVYREMKGIRAKEVRDNGYKILAQFADRYENIIISDEVIWRRNKNIENFWEDVAEEFRKINCRIKVVVYLRRQDLLVQSLWNQSIKASTKRSVYTFREYINKEMYSDDAFDYYSELDKISNVIGKENLIVRVYEDGQFEGEEHSIYSDFLKAVGLEMNDSYSKENIAKNIGLDNNYVEMKRLLNMIPEYEKLGDFLARPMVYANLCQSQGGLHSKESLFSFEEQVDFLEKYSESNRKVAIEFLGREDGILFREPVQKLPEWKMDLEKYYQNLLVFMAEAFCFQEQKIRNEEKKVEDLKEQIQSLEEEIRSSGGLRDKVTAIHRSLIFRGYRKARKVMGRK